MGSHLYGLPVMFIMACSGFMLPASYCPMLKKLPANKQKPVNQLSLWQNYIAQLFWNYVHIMFVLNKEVFALCI